MAKDPAQHAHREAKSGASAVQAEFEINGEISIVMLVLRQSGMGSSTVRGSVSRHCIVIHAHSPLLPE
jgi:hypothetical protein